MSKSRSSSAADGAVAVRAPSGFTPIERPAILLNGERSTSIDVGSLSKLSETERLIVFGSRVVPHDEIAEFVERMAAINLRAQSIRLLGCGGIVLALIGGAVVAVTGMATLPIALPLVGVGSALAGTALVQSFGVKATMKQLTELMRVSTSGISQASNAPDPNTASEGS